MKKIRIKKNYNEFYRNSNRSSKLRLNFTSRCIFDNRGDRCEIKEALRSFQGGETTYRIVRMVILI